MTQWRKSRHSDDRGACVELARLPEGIGLRDSTAPEAGHQTYPRDTMRRLIDRIKAGELDLR